MKMRLVLALGLGFSCLYGQNCVPAPMLPAGQFSGSLGTGSCSLSDGTPYDAYRLVLPGRGQLQVQFSPAVSNLSLILQDSTGAQIASGATLQRQLESGAYTLLVNGQTPAASWTGPASYTLTNVFTPELGTWCANFAAIGLNQTMNGTLGAAGCKTPDGTPYDAWSLNSFGSGTLTVTVSSTAFTPLLIVRDETGTLLGSDPASVSIPVTAFGEYQIVVATGDNTGAYQLTTSFTPASAETCVPQSTLTNSTTDSNNITAGSCSVVIDSGGDLGYFNYYNLTVATAGLADIAVSSSDFGPTLNLLDAAGNTLAIDNGGGSSANGTSSELRVPLAPGSYIVQVFSNFSSGGAYKLSYTFMAGGPQPCVPSAYTVGAAQSGTLSPSSCRTNLGLADLYSVTLLSDGRLNVTLSSSAFPTQVALRDIKDNLIVMNQDVEGLGVSQLTAVLPAGTYTILASASSGAGSYQLTTSFSAATVAPCVQGQPLGLNQGYLQTLGVGSCTGPNGQPVDLYQFTMPSAGVAAAVMTSSEVSGGLTLTDSNGNFLRSDQNSYGVNDPFIVQYLPAGNYLLWARDVTNSVGGTYLMSLLGNLGARPNFCGTQAPLALGGTVSGTLGITSCQYVDNTFADVYQLTLSNDTQVDLRMNSADFDAYLVVLDGKGNLVASDDDSGGGTNARVTQQLTAGTYYVVAKQMGGYYPPGNYTVSLAVYSGQ